MTKFKIPITLLFMLIFIIDSFGQRNLFKEIQPIQPIQQYDQGPQVLPFDPGATIRTNDVIISILDITTQSWNTSVCLEDPNNNDLYEGELGFMDVHKLLDEPYTTNDASFNFNISNHTFWFGFGCCGIEVENAFCADDNSRANVHTDDFWEDHGSLMLRNVETDYETTVWVDFMTQCENCSGGGEGGMGVWHKDEIEYQAGELAFANAFEDIRFSVTPRFMMSVPCEFDRIYGCQNGEINYGD